MRRRPALLLLAVLALASCAAPPAFSPAAAARQIERGTTTKRDVVALLGEPSERTALGGGEELWRYAETPPPTGPSDPLVLLGLKSPPGERRKELAIFFRGDVVREMYVGDIPPPDPTWPGSANPRRTGR